MILEIQYQNYLKENPHSNLTFNEWYFNVWTDWGTNTNDDISDWDNTLMDGLEDED
jgi:hypothetical protein